MKKNQPRSNEEAACFPPSSTLKDSLMKRGSFKDADEQGDGKQLFISFCQWYLKEKRLHLLCKRKENFHG